MDKILKLFNNLLGKYSCIFFIVLTFIYAILRTPFYDEAYSYMVSQLSIKEIFQLIPIEGHPFGYYFLLKIFCSNLNLYPYPMLILSWFIFSIFIYVFWKRAPFNNLIKFLITFSYLFLNYYAVFARPYGLAILLLSLLAVFYKDCTKRPYLYTFLILFSFNICSVSMIGGGAFLCLFLYKIIKEKTPENILISVLFVLFSGLILSMLQFLNVHPPFVYKILNIGGYIKEDILPLYHGNIIKFVFQILRIILIFYIPYLFLKKGKDSLFFIICTYSLMFWLFLKVYPGVFWHNYFYFIFLILALWINWDSFKSDKFLNIILILYTGTLIFPSSILYEELFEITNTRYYKSYIEKVVELNNKKEAKFFSLDWYSAVSSGILPYLKKQNIYLYDAHNYRKDTFESMKNTYKYKNEKFNCEEFIKYLDDTKNNYLLTANFFFYHNNNIDVFRFEKDGFYYKDILFFRGIYISPKYNYSIYKIEKLKK